MNKNPLSIVGLTQKEYSIYVCMLSLGNTTALEIARKTSIKRPTVYVHLEELVRKGFVTQVKVAKKTLYHALQLSVVTSKAEEVYKKYKESIPDLLSISSHAEGKPLIETLEGEQGVLRAYEDMASARVYRIWSDLGKVQKLFSNHFNIIAGQIKQREITTKEILNGSKDAIKSSKNFSVLAGPTYSARVATVEGIMNDSIIYGDTVALFRIHDSNMYVVRIKDETIASSMSAIFDMAWKNAQTVKDYLSSEE